MSSAESARRKRRALLILSEGYVVMPCSLCKSKSLQCVMKDGHKNCAECTRRGRTCDGKGVSVAEGLWGVLFPWFMVLILGSGSLGSGEGAFGG
jgi:hypothetical protein